MVCGYVILPAALLRPPPSSSPFFFFSMHEILSDDPLLFLCTDAFRNSFFFSLGANSPSRLLRDPLRCWIRNPNTTLTFRFPFLLSFSKHAFFPIMLVWVDAEFANPFFPVTWGDDCVQVTSHVFPVFCLSLSTISIVETIYLIFYFSTTDCSVRTPPRLSPPLDLIPSTSRVDLRRRCQSFVLLSPSYDSYLSISVPHFLFVATCFSSVLLRTCKRSFGCASRVFFIHAGAGSPPHPFHPLPLG